MRRKYSLSDKEFWIEIISFSELPYHPYLAKTITATGLKKHILASHVNEIFVTPTMPNVYIQAKNTLFMMPARPYLSFVSCLFFIDEAFELNWLLDGF